jgi:hypothetical protein
MFFNIRFYKLTVWVLFGFVLVVIIAVILGLIPLYTSPEGQISTEITKSFYIRKGLVFQINNQTLADELIANPNTSFSTKKIFGTSNDFTSSIQLQVNRQITIELIKTEFFIS